MSEFEGREKVGGSSAVESGEVAQAAPGRETRAGKLDASPSPGLFTGNEQWESVEAEAELSEEGESAPAKETDEGFAADAGDDTTAEAMLAEIRGGLDQTMTGLAETHVCHAGCLH